MSAERFENCFSAYLANIIQQMVASHLIQSLWGHSCAREAQRKVFHKWSETYLRCKKIEADRLKSWCGPRNPRWPPICRPIFLKMAVYICLQHVFTWFLDSK